MPSLRKLAPLVVAAATAAVFLPVLANGFVQWDDWPMLIENPHYRGLGLSQLRWMFSSIYLCSYQPVSWLTFGLDFTFWGMNPFGYHLTSVLFHCANAAAFYWLCLELLARGEPRDEDRLGAAFAALLFAVHPLRVEAVAWASARVDVVASFFFILCLLAWLRGFRAAALLIYVLALMSKLSVLPLPAVLVLLDLYPLKRLPPSPREWFKPSARGVWLEKWPFAAAAAGFAALGLLAKSHCELSEGLVRATALERAGSALFSLVFYLGKSLSPAGLSPVYEANAHSYAGTLWVGAGALACIGAAACLRRWRPFALTALAYYAITLFPVMGFFQLSPQRAADRYSYLPCLVWSLGLGAGLAAAARSRRPAVRRAFPALLIAAAAATAGLGGLAVRQGAVWHDSVSLWRRALRLDPDSSIARHNLAVGLLEQKRWGEAILYLEEQVRLFPADTPSRELLAKLIARTGTTARDHAKIHAELGYEYERNGEREKAAWHFRKALGYDPSRDLRASLDEALARVGARPVGR